MNLKRTKLPQHIGIIMDGNGRWALKRGYTRLFGHEKGVDAVKKTIDFASEIGIKVLTLFAFSTENWKRSSEEIDGIFEIIEKYLDTDFEEYKNKGIKVRTMGDLSKIPQNLQKKINECITTTQNNKGMIVNVAVNYGARDEIIRAVNNLIKTEKKEVSIDDFKENLYTYGLPDPDLIIRTSGEMRLSNFLLFQSAYSELYFIKTYWPSFNEKHFKRALKAYSKRERRFGGNHN
ncbi:MAG: isoprenyl transferase [Clostridia bacterium]|jgi:undecaprenyl diphosphate synthase|nr:isoprenyl transferase [Clostridia bacterium]MDD3232446.1 isoprenyl transferase [Clostridia bacterium]MDD4408674.1 isoprenyl transferase [Clostridia bacterium]